MPRLLRNESRLAGFIDFSIAPRCQLSPGSDLAPVSFLAARPWEGHAFPEPLSDLALNELGILTHLYYMGNINLMSREFSLILKFSFQFHRRPAPR